MGVELAVVDLVVGKDPIEVADKKEVRAKDKIGRAHV